MNLSPTHIPISTSESNMDNEEVIDKNIALYIKARERATEAHSGQIRRGNGEPYVLHPLRVAAVVAEYVSAEGIAAAVLHDVLEDTDMKIDDFPEYVQQLVRHLTKNDAEGRDEYLQRIADSGCPEAVLIKIADRTDNLVDGKQLGKGWTKGYLKGAAKVIAAAKANGLGNHPLTVNLIVTVEDLTKWTLSSNAV